MKTRKSCFWGNKTLNLCFGANLKKPFFVPNLLLFYVFWLFSTKNAENDYFNQRVRCAGPKRWSKYTTMVYGWDVCSQIVGCYPFIRQGRKGNLATVTDGHDTFERQNLNFFSKKIVFSG